MLFLISMLAALLRALFFAFQRLQRYCEHCFLRFGACSVTASIVFCISMLAALLRALFFAFQRLQRYCEHCFLCFIACSVTASIVFCVSVLAALLRALFFAFQCLQRYCEHCFLRFNACSAPASKRTFGFGLAASLHTCPPLHWTSSTIFLIVDERPNRRFVYIFPCIKIQYFSVG